MQSFVNRSEHEFLDVLARLLIQEDVFTLAGCDLKSSPFTLQFLSGCIPEDSAMTSKKAGDSDDRFLRVKKDPRFWEMPERERKIKIDKRFQSMFHDKRFKLKYTVDKRGRPFNHSSSEDLKRFYELTDSDQSDDQDEQVDEKQIKKKQKSKVKAGPEENTQAGEPLEDLQEEIALETSRKPPKLKRTLERSSKPMAAQSVKGVTKYEKGEILTYFNCIYTCLHVTF